MLTWLRDLRRSRSANKAPRRASRTRLGFEQLEDRRLMSISGQLVPFSPVEGISAPSQGAVATFTDSNTSNANYMADVTWGDGAQTLNIATLPNNGVFSVFANHTYNDELGGVTFSVLIKKFVSGSQVDALPLSRGLTVADAALHASVSGDTIPNQTEGAAFNNG